MKTIPGKIIIGIDNKVYFEYYELEKPPPSYHSGCHLGYRELKLRKYEASKQLVEVENAYFHRHLRTWMFREHISYKILVKNNQPCKASIKDNKATIIELTK